MNGDNAIRQAEEIFRAALEAVDPCRIARACHARIRALYNAGHFDKLIVVGFGKASCLMAKAIEESLGDLIDAGAVITKYGHSPAEYRPHKIMVTEAGHPVPDDNGLQGTADIIRLLEYAGPATLVVCLISGGGSALLVSPCEGITLREKQAATELLLRAGADIGELNTVRKHISRVKGGRLAEYAYPARMISLILSDVIGDRPDIIASGPTAPDPATYRDALAVLEKYRLTRRVAPSILRILARGAGEEIPETPKEGHPVFEDVENIVIGSNCKALSAARIKAEALGYAVVALSDAVQGEAREVGKRLARLAMAIRASNKSVKPVCLISGGEPTVTVRGKGKGGRNTELALAFALETEGAAGITLLSAGTDGTDGPTDAAGAFADGLTIGRARNAGLDPEAMLTDNDSYTFFSRIESLLVTGPTGTNVMDIQIVLIEKTGMPASG